MAITRQALEERLGKLRQGLDRAQKALGQAQAEANAFDGAMQECEYWIAQFDAAESDSGTKKEEGKPPPKEEAKT